MEEPTEKEWHEAMEEQIEVKKKIGDLERLKVTLDEPARKTIEGVVHYLYDRVIALDSLLTPED
jgi:hypothetical protein